MAAPSFDADIKPMLFNYRAHMMWRFDMADYGQMKANAQIIYNRISDPNNPMPPPPFPPLSAAQIATFQTWMENGCPP